MYIVQLLLTSRQCPRPTQADADRVLDTLWAHALPGDGLEHVRSRAGPHRIDLVLFLREPSQADPPSPGPSLASLARLVAPLAGWHAFLPADP